MITVQVVYALPHKATIVECELEKGSNVLQAITQSNVASLHNLTLQDHLVGIYGKLCLLTDLVNHGDRIEIYRKLINDPKEIRRRRAAQKATP